MSWLDQFRRSSGFFEQCNEFVGTLADRNICSRIVDQDTTLWTDNGFSSDEVEHWLDWANPFEHSLEIVDQVKPEPLGSQPIVLIGMGGASLAAKAFASVFGKLTGRSLDVLESTSPETLGQHLAQSADGRHYIVSSKSGSTIETFDIARTVYEHSSAVDRFTVITDSSSSPLRNWAEQNGLQTFPCNPYVGGRFSALSVLGLIPAKMLGIDLQGLRDEFQKQVDLMRAEHSEYCRNVRQLGAAVAASSTTPGGELVLSCSSRLLPVIQWVEQLVAESLGKKGVGVLPVIEEQSPNTVDELRISIRTSELAPVTVFRTKLRDEKQLASTFFVWEVVVAMAGYLLELNPFVQPDVEASKQSMRDTLDSVARNGKLEALSDIEVLEFGDDKSVQPIQEIFEKISATVNVSDYVAILAYIDPEFNNERALAEFTTAVNGAVPCSVVRAYGPQYLHSTGQFYKGGPVNGHFLVIEAYTEADIQVVDRDYTFGQLIAAQAQADTQILRKLELPVYRIQLHQPVATGLCRMTEALQKTAL